MIRVISGEFGGRKLKTPNGCFTRPTADRVREALFNILGPLDSVTTVWDLCAGSGALGVEALSRGAKRAVFVDHDPRACRTLNQNLHALGVTSRATVIQASLERFLSSLRHTVQPAELIFSDPPYASGELERLLAWFALPSCNVPGPGGRVVLETDVRQAAKLCEWTAKTALACVDSRRYGDTTLLFLARNPQTSVAQDPS